MYQPCSLAAPIEQQPLVQQPSPSPSP